MIPAFEGHTRKKRPPADTRGPETKIFHPSQQAECFITQGRSPPPQVPLFGYSLLLSASAMGMVLLR